MNPDYRYEVVEHEGVRVLRIWDNDVPGTTSVTNAAELVLNQILAKEGSLPSLIIYQDTEQHWDRMLAYVREQEVRHVTFSAIRMGVRWGRSDDAALSDAVREHKASLSFRAAPAQQEADK